MTQRKNSAPLGRSATHRRPAPSPTLLALTASALAALGSGRAQAQQSATSSTPQVDYRFSSYRESALPRESITSGNGERYEIETHQFRLTQPLGERDSLSADLGYETMSGASPRYVLPDSSGRPVEVMSGASIQDARDRKSVV